MIDDTFLILDGAINGKRKSFRCGDQVPSRVRGRWNAEAKELYRRMARRKPREYWIWTSLADACADDSAGAADCLCKVLTCRIRDAEIERAVAASTHRRLARMAAAGDCATAAREAAYAQGAPVLETDAARYEERAKAACDAVLGKFHRDTHGVDADWSAIRAVMKMQREWKMENGK